MPPVDPSQVIGAQSQPQLGQPWPTSGYPPLSNIQPQKTTADIAATNQGITQKSQLFPSQLQEQQDKAEAARLQLRLLRQQQGLDPDTGLPAQNDGKIGQDYLAELAQNRGQAYADTVKAFTEGRMPPGGSFSFRSPQYFQLLQDAARYEPGFDLTAFQRRAAATQKYLSNPNSPVIRLNQAFDHLNDFYQAGVALNNPSSGSVLATPEAAAHVVGMSLDKDPRLTQFNVAKNFLATELAAAAKGSNDPNVASIQEHLSSMGPTSSPEQFRAFANEAAKFLGGRVDANQYQFQQALGPNANQWDLMTPNARAVYNMYASDNFLQQPPGSEKVTTPNPAQHLSIAYERVPVPAGYQAAHAAALAKIKRGTLTVPAYIALRQQLDNNFAGELPDGFKSQLDPSDVQNFVDQFNKGGAITKIPALNVPVGALHKAAAAAATSVPGTVLENAANAALAGAPEALSNQESRDAFHAANAANPVSAIVGDIGGSVMPIGGIENTAIKLFPKLAQTSRGKIAADIIANSLYQGSRGYSDANDGQGATGLANGLASGAAAGVAGNFFTKGATPFLSKTMQDALNTVGGNKNLTFLQRLGFGRSESVLSGVPGIHGAVEKSMAGLDTDNANRALANISPTIESPPEGDPLAFQTSVPNDVQPGFDTTKFTRQQLSNAYEAVKPNVGGTISGLDDAMADLRNQVDNKRSFVRIKNAVNQFGSDGDTFNGDDYKNATTSLRQLIQDYANDGESGHLSATDSRDLAGASQNAINLIRDQVRFNNPEVGSQLSGLEKGWAHLARIQDATRRAATNDGIYTPNQLMQSTIKLDTSGRKVLSAEGQAFEQPYARAAQTVMGTGQPVKAVLRDAGWTLGTLATLGAGGHYLGGTAADVLPMLGGVAAAGYLPGIRRFAQAFMFGRPPAAADIAAVRKVFGGANAARLDSATRHAIESAIGSSLQGNLPAEGNKQ